jgi:hypothetical protein
MLRFSPSRAPGETSPDLFSEIIRYGIPLATIPGTSTPQYNGNISQIEWQVAGREGQAYSFAYDDLDRLTDAVYSDRRSNGTYLTDNKFREKAVYDVRGNTARSGSSTVSLFYLRVPKRAGSRTFLMRCVLFMASHDARKLL